MDELIWKVVMVDPRPSLNPIARKGECCTICAFDEDLQVAQVRFADGAFESFTTDTLVMLVPPQLTIERLRFFKEPLHPETVATLLELQLLYLSRYVGASRKALEEVMNNHDLPELATATVAYWIETFGQQDRHRPRSR